MIERAENALFEVSILFVRMSVAMLLLSTPFHLSGLQPLLLLLIIGVCGLTLWDTVEVYRLFTDTTYNLKRSGAEKLIGTVLGAALLAVSIAAGTAVFLALLTGGMYQSGTGLLIIHLCIGLWYYRAAWSLLENVGVPAGIATRLGLIPLGWLALLPGAAGLPWTFVLFASAFPCLALLLWLAKDKARQRKLYRKLLDTLNTSEPQDFTIPQYEPLSPGTGG